MFVPKTFLQPILVKDSKDLNEWLEEIINNVSEYKVLIIPETFTHKYINYKESYLIKEYQ